MKIAFLTGLYPPQMKGGGELSTHFIAQGLLGLGHEVTVFTEGGSREEVRFEGVTVVHVPFRLTAKPLFEQLASRRLARSLKSELSNFEIVHAHDFRSALVLAELALPHSVATVRDYAQVAGDTHLLRDDGVPPTGLMGDAWHSWRVQEAAWPRKIFRWWQFAYNLSYRKKSFRAIPHHIYISEAQRSLISHYQNLAGITSTVIFNPVPVSYLDTSPQLGTQGAVLYVGRVEHYKGVGLLLRAWQDVIKRNSQARLRIIGDGAQRAQYEDFVFRHGLHYSVTFEGHVPWSRLQHLYDEARIVVAPHLWVEPFGRTIVEGMARGKVVLAAALGGPQEVIQDKKTGFLFKPASTSELTNSLVETLALPDQSALKIGEAARQWVSEELGPTHIADQYLRFYQEQVLS